MGAHCAPAVVGVTLSVMEMLTNLETKSGKRSSATPTSCTVQTKLRETTRRTERFRPYIGHERTYRHERKLTPRTPVLHFT